MAEGLSIQRNIAWNTVGSVVRLGCNYLITVLVVRLSHGYDAAGVLSLAMSVSNLVSPIAEFRLRTVHVTDVRGEHSSGEYLGLRLLTCGLSFVVGVVYALATCTLSAVPCVVIYLAYSLACCLGEGLHAIEQRHMRMDIIGRVYMAQGVLSLAAFSSILWLTDSLELACLGMVAAVVVVLLAYDLPQAGGFESVRPVVNWRTAGATLAGLVPLVLAQVCANAVLTVPKQYLSASVGAASLGIYSSVASPAAIVQMGATYLYSPLIGEFAKRFAESRESGMRLFRKTVLSIVGVCLTLAVLLVAFGAPILGLLYGDDIVQYVYLLGPAVLCTFVTAFSWFMNDLLLALRDFRASFLGNAIATVVSLVATIPLVDAFSMNGVSWVGVVSYGGAVLSLALFLAHDVRRMA